MENASKALIMAGSVLMSLIVIGTVVFMYNRLSAVEQTKTNVEESSKSSNYNNKFERYNTTIYGSELLSLANLQEDYNKKQIDEEGYVKKTITVTIKRKIESDGVIYFSQGTQNIEAIFTSKENIEAEIARLGSVTSKKEEYENLKSSYTEFKSKRFKCTYVGYDSNDGQINEMIFAEQ